MKDVIMIIAFLVMLFCATMFAMAMIETPVFGALSIINLLALLVLGLCGLCCVEKD